MKTAPTLLNRALEWTRKFDFIAPLSIRLYLLPTLYTGAHAKVTGFSGVVDWFGASAANGGLGLPFPTLMASLAAGTEVAGVICLALGLFTRVISVPLLVLMTVAGLSVHWSHGWAAIADKTTEASLRMDGLMAWLAHDFPGRFNYVTELGDPVILNNGIEFTVTFLLMILVLFFHGAGRYVSADYWLARKFPRVWPA
ncbi:MULTISPECIES: DoxX family protein [Stenotrophomonas]|uniref:DoxX family protein n=1 Tax=Stenotrophomonas lactitubi TaxID=2045214 RepID=A0AAW4GJB7_9GAMM|nr:MULTISPECIES: DoxX family protein [Stenotrophomonas]MBM9914543.1 DoxX family protein [Stenotrophomonas lactitubi]MBM9922836.1 DoxX family protein [Stenotrophomonas lactitubi]MBM9938672.1 DoxX family protein [Stenotrophomonas lactitubi]